MASGITIDKEMIVNPIWEPSLDTIKKTNITSFQNYANQKYELNLSNYKDLHAWSTRSPENFWSSLLEFTKVKYEGDIDPAVDGHMKMPGTKWFPNLKLNFAENLLRFNNKNIAIESHREDGDLIQLSYKELTLKVESSSNYFKSIGIKEGDRIAAIIPNIPEAIIFMLAASSIGAIWTACSPDFGEDAILERFTQVHPKVLISTDGYLFKGKYFSIQDKVSCIISKLPKIKSIIMIDYIKENNIISSKMIKYDSLNDYHQKNKIKYQKFKFDHPLYIVYSSGTTGKPKSIVHSAGGTLLQHLKELILHTNIKEEDKIFYYTTCGWMMWNWLASSLAIGATVVLYDGSPFYPESDRLLTLSSERDINIFGTSAKYIDSIRMMKISPKDISEFPNLRTILSTGSPLTDENFEYVYSNWKKDIQLSSISGGTDIISCFALGNPNLPVYKGELQCLGLGMDVKSYNMNGDAIISEKGELVCATPFPSMPIYFWNDEDGEKYHKAYFSKFKNIWTHGDYISINKNGGVRILGRSDATLNPGGIRIGTSEIYKVVENLDKILDSVAIGKKIDNDERIILFIKTNARLTDEMILLIKNELRTKCSPKHVPYKIFRVKDIPYTLNGKKIEIAVKNIINGDKILNRSSIVNPESLKYFDNLSI